MVNDICAIDIIAQKRDAKVLSPKEIDWFVRGIVDGRIPDYQISALLMAIFLNGMDIDETLALTKSMIESGERLSLPISKPKFDKHSTGGVGDKVSLILAPLITSCGIAVPMLSGSSLGYTGGTLNKLESIPGMGVYLSIEEMEKEVKDIGMVIAGQTERIAPADKKIYRLRDETGTVEAIPLITSSILSKKLSEDIDGLILDVKVGRGAFMKTTNNARALVESITRVSKKMGIKTKAFITNMNVPLGNAVGTGVEVYEALKVLRGEECPFDLMEVTLALSHAIVDLAGLKGVNLTEKIRDGKAFRKFREFVEFQGGDVSYVDTPEKLLEDCTRDEIVSNKNAFMVGMDTERIGRIAVETEKVSPGIIFHKKVGDRVEKGDLLAVIFFRKDIGRDTEPKGGLAHYIQNIKDAILSSYEFGANPLPIEKMIIERL
jgi:pyrimidine-nucleoside phosphorylase